MALTYEKAVKEDLNIGYGTATVTMPGGGTATGNKIGTHSLMGDWWNVKDVGALGDGSTDDRASLNTAEALVQSTGGTLFFPAGTYRVSSSLSFGTDVTLFLAHGAKFSVDSGVTVTVSGVIRAGRTQIMSGSGTLDVTDALLDWVYPEWWGAVALKAATGTPADSTTAIEAAINSRRNVLFDQGLYGTTGLHRMATDGQVVHGQGQQLPSGVDGQGGTRIVRLSGTNYILQMGAYLHMELSDFLFDGNSLGGNAVQCVASLYATLRRLRFVDVAGTSYALYLSNINVVTFDQITLDTNYGHIQTDSGGQCLYSTWTNLITGTVTGGYAFDFQNASYFTFQGGVIEGPMRTGANCRGLRFYGTTAGDVTVTTVPYFALDSSSWNISWDGGYFNQLAVTTQPFFEIDGTRGVTLSNFEVRDGVSAAGRDLIQLKNAAFGIEVSRWSVYANNTFNLIVCSGTKSSNIETRGNHWHSGGAGTNVWLTSSLTVDGGNINQTFAVGMDSPVVLIRPVGTVTKTNAAIMQTIGVTDVLVTLTDQDTTPDISAGSNYVRADSVATTVTDLDGGYEGQTVLIVHNNGNTTYDFSSNVNLRGNAGVDWTAPTNSALRATRSGIVWYCTIMPAT